MTYTGLLWVREEHIPRVPALDSVQASTGSCSMKEREPRTFKGLRVWVLSDLRLSMRARVDHLLTETAKDEECEAWWRDVEIILAGVGCSRTNENREG